MRDREISLSNIPRDIIRKCIDVILVEDIENVKNRENSYLNSERINLDHLFRNRQYDLYILYNVTDWLCSQFSFLKKKYVEAHKLNYCELTKTIINNLAPPSSKMMNIFVAPIKEEITWQ